jgi:hypothetical protein
MVAGRVVKELRIAIDLAFVVLFVALGRSAHRHGISFGGMASTTWPFAVGLGLAWILLALGQRTGLTLKEGSFIVAVTVGVGMVLRVVSGQGTAVAFVFVALAFLGLFFLVWRLAYRMLSHSR